MQRRHLLRSALATFAAGGLAGCSESGSTPTEGATATPTPTATATPTDAPDPGDRSLDPYRSWLVAPTPVSPYTYEFSHLSFTGIRADATRTFADRLDAYWRQRSSAYFGVEVPIDPITAVLTVNHAATVNESYRVAAGSFDREVLRGRLADAGFEATGRVADFERFVGTQDGRTRVVGLHPDLYVIIGLDDGDADPLETAVEQHRAGDQRYRDHDGLAVLIDHLGTDDFVTGRELEPRADDEFPLSGAVATGRRLDVSGSTSWVERAYVFGSDATVDREAFEQAIEQTHVGQPTTEFARDGRVVSVAGEVENSLVRLL